MKDTNLEVVGHAVQCRRVQMGREVSGLLAGGRKLVGFSKKGT